MREIRKLMPLCQPRKELCLAIMSLEQEDRNASELTPARVRVGNDKVSELINALPALNKNICCHKITPKPRPTKVNNVASMKSMVNLVTLASWHRAARQSRSRESRILVARRG